MISKIIKFFRTWNELLLGASMFLLWIPFVIFMRFIDPTASVMDAGVLHIIYMGMLSFGVMHGFIWFGIKLNFPKIWTYFQREFDNDFIERISPFQRQLMSFLWVALYLIVAVMCLRFW